MNMDSATVLQELPMERRIAEVIDLVLKNNDAIRTGTGSISTVTSIASKVRSLVDTPDMEFIKFLYGRIGSALFEYFQTQCFDPLINAKDNSRDLFTSINLLFSSNPFTSMERALRLSFFGLDDVIRRMNLDFMSTAELPMAALAKHTAELAPAICRSLFSRMNELRDGSDVSLEAVRKVVDLIRTLNYPFDESALENTWNEDGTNLRTSEPSVDVAACFHIMRKSSADNINCFCRIYCESVRRYYKLRAVEKYSSMGATFVYTKWATRCVEEERLWIVKLSIDQAWEGLPNEWVGLRYSLASYFLEPTGNDLSEKLHEGSDVSDLFALLELIKSTSDAEDGVKRAAMAYYHYTLASVRIILDAPEPPPEPVPEGQKPRPRPKHTTVVFKELMAFVEHHLLTVWPKQFKGNSIVIASFDKALTELLRDHKTYDYIPRAHSDFCGEFIRSLPEDGLRPEVLDRLSVLKKVFVCITQKDEFIPHYKAALARRLLRPNFYRAVEGHLLHDIKSVVGNADVYHLESMIRDIETSTALTKAFCESRMATIDSKLKLTFIPTSRQHWPALNVTTATIPPAIGQYLDMYEKFYNAKFPSRRLEWAYDISNAAVHVAFAAGPKEVSGSLMQIMVMLALDGSPSGVSIEALAAALGVSVMTATDVLASCVLSLHKVVRPCVIPPPGTRPRLRPEDKFTLNEGFKAPVRKIDLPQVQTSKAKVTDVETEVEQRRNLRTQIEIIRYMKSHGKSLYAEMVEYVLTNLRRSFDAQQSMIKTQLDNLIDKQFVERDPDNRNLLHYIA